VDVTGRRVYDRQRKLDPRTCTAKKVRMPSYEVDFERTEEGGVEAQVELGLGPLHTQFDDQGYAYTSLFLDSAVAKWKLGPPYHPDGWKLINKISVHYNVGHISAAEGDTVSPDGKYLISLNKWSVDRFFPPGRFPEPPAHRHLDPTSRAAPTTRRWAWASRTTPRRSRPTS
jgi:nitrous oxide reductase